MIRVSILGATGYSGGELLKLLLRHPSVTLAHLTSESSPGKPIEAVHPHLRHRTPLRFEKLNIGSVAKDSDVVFACYPHAVGMKPCAQLVKAGVRVIDLSADFRLPSASLFKTWYKTSHAAPALLRKSVYGLPEFFRKEIPEAPLIANPGCYATASILATAPLIQSGLVDPCDLVVDAKSGLSGAGKKVALSHIFSEINENFQAYSVASHRHQPEIESVLEKIGSKRTQLTFVPHLVPMTRGILANVYAKLKKSVDLDTVHAVFSKTYYGEPFVRVLPLGELPQTKHVKNTNYCDIGFGIDPRNRRVIVMAALDNLVKGAAGQAIQNMNLCFNRSEQEGLL